MSNALEVQAITVGYGGPPVVSEASIWAASGEISLLIGPNGAGKSTLAKAVVGLLKPEHGRTVMSGVDISDLPVHQRARQGLAYMPQIGNVFNEMTVLENLELSCLFSGRRPRDEVPIVVERLPELKDVLRKKAGELSGGQQRIVALARIAVLHPVAIVLDEPTAGLSPLYIGYVWTYIRGIAESGVAILVVEQNVRSALAHADEVFMMRQSRIVAHERGTAIIGNDQIAAFLLK